MTGRGACLVDWWIRVAEDRASCCCSGGDSFGVRGGCLGAACTYRAADTNEQGQDNMQHTDGHNYFVFMSDASSLFLASRLGRFQRKAQTFTGCSNFKVL
jgi:hypothetical protein